MNLIKEYNFNSSINKIMDRIDRINEIKKQIKVLQEEESILMKEIREAIGGNEVTIIPSVVESVSVPTSQWKPKISKEAIEMNSKIANMGVKEVRNTMQGNKRVIEETEWIGEKLPWVES